MKAVQSYVCNGEKFDEFEQTQPDIFQNWVQLPPPVGRFCVPVTSTLQNANQIHVQGKMLHKSLHVDDVRTPPQGGVSNQAGHVVRLTQKKHPYRYV